MTWRYVDVELKGETKKDKVMEASHVLNITRVLTQLRLINTLRGNSYGSNEALFMTDSMLRVFFYE